MKDYNNIEIKTFLPVFTGFYNTLFEADNEESEVEYINNERAKKDLEPITYDDCNFDYAEYHNDVSKKCVDSVETKLQEILNEDVKIEFEKLVIPKEYNFTNDSINIKIALDDDARKKVLEIVLDNLEEFKVWVKDTHTSYDEFMSFNSNDPAHWINVITTWVDSEDRLSYKVGSVLGFILEQVYGYGQQELYDDIKIPLVNTLNYDNLINGKEDTDE